MGPAPWTVQYVPWRTEIPTLRCPSDPGAGLPAFARTNYAACLGDSIDFMNNGPIEVDSDGFIVEPPQIWVVERARAACRGVFVARQDMKFRDIMDGLSNTIICGEITTDLGDRSIRTNAAIQNDTVEIRDEPDHCQHDGFVSPERPRFWSTGSDGGNLPILAGATQGRGYRWADAGTVWTDVNTILPPNRELCLGGGPSGGVGSPGVAPVSSQHQGGAHILMADGAVIFITDSIEAGNVHSGNVWLDGSGTATKGMPSPYGLWGALGTRASQEPIQQQLNQ